MVELLGSGIEAEQLQVYEEARSVLGSLVTRLIGIVQQIMAFVTQVARQLMTYAGEHPLALTLTVANICVWMA